MSEVKNNIYSRLINFQSLVGKISKDSKNPFYKSKYANFASIQEAIKLPLAEAGVGYMQEATLEGLITTIFSKEGETIKSIYPLKLEGLKPQEIGSAVSYAKRYSLCAMLGIIISDEDDDGQTANNSSKRNMTKIELDKIILGLQDPTKYNQVLSLYANFCDHPMINIPAEYSDKIENEIIKNQPSINQ